MLPRIHWRETLRFRVTHHTRGSPPRGRATLARVRWNMSPYPSRNVHVPRQRGPVSLEVLNIITPALVVAGSTARSVCNSVLRRYRSHPFRGDRDYLNKAIYVTYHRQDNSCAMRDTFAHGVSRRRVLPNARATCAYIPQKKKCKNKKRSNSLGVWSRAKRWKSIRMDHNELVCDDLILGANIVTVYMYRMKKVVSEEDKGCARWNGEEIEVGTRCAPTDKHWSQLHVGIELFPSWADHGLLTPSRLLRGRRHNW